MYPTNESTASLEARLKADGRYDEFYARFKQIRSEGVEGSIAWSLAKAEYPPPVKEELPPPPPHKIRRKNKKDDKDNEVDAIRWVAANLKLEDVTEQHAPGGLAANLLAWARQSPQNEAEFWKSLFTKVLPTKGKLDDDAANRDDGRKTIEIMDRLLGLRANAIDWAKDTEVPDEV